jgi:glycosyltransferase involved in cell wall biosynthesis
VDGSAQGKRAVLFLHTATLPPLGADTWVHVQLITKLDRATHDLHIACVTGSASAPTPTYQAVRDIPHLRVVPANLGTERSQATGRLAGLIATLPALPTMVRLARHVRCHRIRVIHTSDRPRDALAAVVLARLTGATSVVHVHVGYAPWMGRVLRWSLGRANVLVAISEFVGRTLVEGGHRPDRIQVVLNAIDPSIWEPGVGRDEARQELGVEQGTPVVITVCRLFKEKGPAELIRAIALVRHEYPDVKLLVVGSDVTGGAFAAELANLVEHLGVEENVTFTGRRSDVRRLMAAADVFAMPSFDEPFGLVYLEAMAMQLPVVALDNGGTPEVVEHGQTGLLSSSGDVEAVARHLLTLLRSPDLRAQMGAHGRRRVEQHFTTDRQASDMAAVYALIESRSARR